MKKHGTKKGFTLIEIVLSITIMAVVVGLLFPLISGGMRSYSLVTARRSAAAEARLSLNRMASEIMLIQARTNISTWNASTLTFDLATETGISYAISGGTLTRKGVAMASNAVSLTFTYMDSTGAVASNIDDVDLIRIDLLLSAGSNYGNVRLRTAVFPRAFYNAYAGFE